MAFCPHCGAPVSSSICRKCGSPASAALDGGLSAGSTLSGNGAAALCYLLFFVTGLLFLILEPYSRNRNIRFHAYQSIFLSVAWLAINVFLGLLIPLSLMSARLNLLNLLQLAGTILWVFLMWKTYNGERVVLPLIGPQAERLS